MLILLFIAKGWNSSISSYKISDFDKSLHLFVEEKIMLFDMGDPGLYSCFCLYLNQVEVSAFICPLYVYYLHIYIVKWLSFIWKKICLLQEKSWNKTFREIQRDFKNVRRLVHVTDCSTGKPTVTSLQAFFLYFFWWLLKFTKFHLL